MQGCEWSFEGSDEVMTAVELGKCQLTDHGVFTIGAPEPESIL